MTITGQSSLNKDEIARMVKDAEAHAEDDRRRKEEAEVRNQADQLEYQIEKLLKEQGDKVPADERTRVEQALTDLKAAKAGTDTEAIKRAVEQLATASQTMSQKLYEAASAANASGAGTDGPAGGPSSGGRNDDDVIDAEIVDEK